MTSGCRQQGVILIICMVVFYAFSPAVSAGATTLFIPSVTAKAGDSVQVPIRIDAVDNLAGIKLVIRYDTALFTYEKARKTDKTASLMHVVNDKNPGTLIIVMAGAKGIKGKDMTIMRLTFKVTRIPGLKAKTKSKFEIPEVQMMNDQLKEIKCDVRVNPIIIN